MGGSSVGFGIDGVRPAQPGGKRGLGDNPQGLMSDLPLRGPFPTELDFFRKHPTVSGMATEDDAIILNPFSDLSGEQQRAVAVNEAVRLFLRKSGSKPEFSVTPEQRKVFEGFAQSGVPGERSEEDIRATILGRIISGDNSVSPFTAEQLDAADAIRRRMSGRK